MSMMDFSQTGRLFKLDTPLGEDVLLLGGLEGEEGISKLYSFKLNLLSSDHNISFKEIIGKNVTISVALADRKTRYINGVVSEFAQVGSGEYGETGVILSSYTARVVPWLWLLTRATDSRIFQNMTVPEIVEKIFKEKQLNDFKINLKATYEKKEYCVQYRETDFNFVSRLLEEEGIYYFFQHEDGKHVLVLADDPSEHKPCPEQISARCRQHAGMTYYGEDVIETLQVRQEIRAGKYTLSDFNFETPNTSLKAEEPSNQILGPGEREYYDYPGGYTKKSDGDRLAKIRMQSQEAEITTLEGESSCRAFMSGYKFRVEDFYRTDMDGKELVLTGIRHTGRQSYTLSEADAESAYKNNFSCIPVDVPYRPPRETPRPYVKGAQTAIVVGPSGEEIYTDKHGRVKVQFHWDREGKKNEKSSCWIRVGQVWAGAGWGTMFIPRIGHEVIVDFLEGNPDMPIVTGRVYHGINQPPYPLPDEKTKSTLKSQTTPGGGGSNELRFEDKTGSEQIYAHAEKDLDIVVNANETREVGGNRTTHVQGHFQETIDAGEDRTVQAGVMETISGGETRDVSGGITESVSGGETRTINGGQTQTVNGGQTQTVNGGQTETINGGETRTVNGGLTETVNGSLVQKVAGGMTIDSPAGVTITAPAGFTVVSPGGTRTIDSMFTKIGGKDEDLFAVQTAILNISTTICALSISAQSMKLETTGFKVEKVGMYAVSPGVEIGDAGIKLWKVPLSVWTCGLFSVT